MIPSNIIESDKLKMVDFISLVESHLMLYRILLLIILEYQMVYVWI